MQKPPITHMKSNILSRSVIAGSLLYSVFLSPTHGKQVFFPLPGLVDQSTGFMESKVDGEWYRGSGVIARDPKLIYSCAHLYYEGGKWATNYRFFRAYHGRSFPDSRDAASPRGLHYFTSYSTGVKSYGSDSDRTFASDFTVLYGNSDFGPAVGWWSKGGPALRSNQPKRVVGYPADIDYTGELGRVFQHATAWFDYPAYRVVGGFHEFEDVSTGPGNSGGPVFVRDNLGNEDLAGILVAGTRRTAGVVALDLSTDTLAGYALGLKEITRSFSNKTPLRLPDGGKAYTAIPIKVSGFSGSIVRLKVSLSVTTRRRGDLDVFLRSPAGRIRWISKRDGGTADNLQIDNLDLSGIFRGTAANGTWEIWIRDAVKGSASTFQNASIKVSAL
jgi:hypothetical protein